MHNYYEIVFFPAIPLRVIFPFPIVFCTFPIWYRFPTFAGMTAGAPQNKRKRAAWLPADSRCRGNDGRSTAKLKRKSGAAANKSEIRHAFRSRAALVFFFALGRASFPRKWESVSRQSPTTSINPVPKCPLLPLLPGLPLQKADKPISICG